MNKVIIILSFLLAGSNIDANAGEKYKLEVDRFTDIKTSSYKAILNKECKLTKSLKSRIASCLFINSTESSIYPSISIGTTSDGCVYYHIQAIKLPTLLWVLMMAQ